MKTVLFSLGELPTICKVLEDITVAFGEDATFSCEFSQSGLDVIWTKEGKELKNSQKYKISQEHTFMTLVVHNVTAKDAGQYCCHVTDGPTSKAKMEITGQLSVYLTVYKMFNSINTF